MLKALAHPARIAIIQQLTRFEHCICSDLVNELGLAQPTISQHLKELKNIGIIKGCVEGKSISYCINQKVWMQVKKEFDSLFASKGEPIG
ncbi:ArsR/SmtB family transcription factor [Hydrotalea sp.]|uniref:ArsR/SmtB family transcription factor n=1 Tax=Hydrotalea sp. TaxID=2881279 RepID=UPI003D13F600